MLKISEVLSNIVNFLDNAEIKIAAFSSNITFRIPELPKTKGTLGRTVGGLVWTGDAYTPKNSWVSLDYLSVVSKPPKKLKGKIDAAQQQRVIDELNKLSGQINTGFTGTYSTLYTSTDSIKDIIPKGMLTEGSKVKVNLNNIEDLYKSYYSAKASLEKTEEGKPVERTVPDKEDPKKEHVYYKTDEKKLEKEKGHISRIIRSFWKDFEEKNNEAIKNRKDILVSLKGTINEDILDNIKDIILITASAEKAISAFKEAAKESKEQQETTEKTEKEKTTKEKKEKIKKMLKEKKTDAEIAEEFKIKDLEEFKEELSKIKEEVKEETSKKEEKQILKKEDVADVKKFVAEEHKKGLGFILKKLGEKYNAEILNELTMGADKFGGGVEGLENYLSNYGSNRDKLLKAPPLMNVDVHNEAIKDSTKKIKDYLSDIKKHTGGEGRVEIDFNKAPLHKFTEIFIKEVSDYFTGKKKSIDFEHYALDTLSYLISKWETTLKVKKVSENLKKLQTVFETVVKDQQFAGAETKYDHKKDEELKTDKKTDEQIANQMGITEKALVFLREKTKNEDEYKKKIKELNKIDNKINQLDRDLVKETQKSKGEKVEEVTKTISPEDRLSPKDIEKLEKDLGHKPTQKEMKDRADDLFSKEQEKKKEEKEKYKKEPGAVKQREKSFPRQPERELSPIEKEQHKERIEKEKKEKEEKQKQLEQESEKRHIDNFRKKLEEKMLYKEPTEHQKEENEKITKKIDEKVEEEKKLRERLKKKKSSSVIGEYSPTMFYKLEKLASLSRDLMIRAELLDVLRVLKNVI